MPPGHSRRGMTLIEVVAALAVAGFALLGALLLLDQVSDGSVRIAKQGTALALDGNGARLMRQLLLDSYSTPDSADWFHGEANSATFTTRCQQPGGWMAACRATLILDRRGDSATVLAELSTGETLLLVRVAENGSFRYFDPRATDSAWTGNWMASIRIPAALGIITNGDTSIHMMGGARE